MNEPGLNFNGLSISGNGDNFTLCYQAVSGKYGLPLATRSGDECASSRHGMLAMAGCCQPGTISQAQAEMVPTNRPSQPGTLGIEIGIASQ
jgi:hypothetical protein